MAISKTVIFLSFLLVVVYYCMGGNKGDSKATISPNGFTSVMMPKDSVQDVVYVFASSSSCQEESLPAYELVMALKDKNIPYDWIGSYSATTDGGMNVDEHNAKVARTHSLFEGQRPIVFINGKGKANPSFQEVESEYKLSKSKR